ncbi:MAG TPA: carboxypeptidase regulatory-like domain-containing protein [Bacteroidota bacterium]|nr:carboxypeptidase regulatory-like domain-containing protein [Bacteroidota bacterium]
MTTRIQGNHKNPQARIPPLRITTLGYMAIVAIFLLGLDAMSRDGLQGERTGTISGKITPPPDDLLESLRRGKKMLRYDDVAHASEPIEPYRLAEVAVVYVEDVPDGEHYTLPAVNPGLNQSQMVFRPLVLPVVVGTTVDFPNNDNLFHNVFSYSQAKEFDLGRYPRGRKRSVTFDKPGIVNVYCDIHSYMFATILVLTNPYFSLPGEDGSFSIPGVPQGTYDLTFWYGRKKVSTRKVKVDGDKTSSVNFP